MKQKTILTSTQIDKCHYLKGQKKKLKRQTTPDTQNKKNKKQQNEQLFKLAIESRKRNMQLRQTTILTIR